MAAVGLASTTVRLSDRGYLSALAESVGLPEGCCTGQIFEIIHPDFPSLLAGGGRYDKLIGRSLDEDIPACGFSIGFERIVDLLGRTHYRDAVAVLYDSDVPMTRALAIARGLRTDDQRVAVIGRSGKLGAQLARLESWGFTALVHLRVDEDSDVHPPMRALGGCNPDQV